MSNFLMVKQKQGVNEFRLPSLVKNYKYRYQKNSYVVLLSDFTRFYNDCVFEESGNGPTHIMLAGVVLNSNDIREQHHLNNMADAVLQEYKSKGEQFHSGFQGSFLGSIYDASTDNTVLFTDALSNYPIYYYQDDDWVIASNLIKLVVSEMKSLGIRTELDDTGAYSLLTYAYYYGNLTMVKGVKRLTPGKYIIIDHNEVTLKTAYRLPEQNFSGSDEEAIDQIDNLFLEAIELQAEKNREYGYSNYTALSGGLDSRMCAFALKRINAEKVVCYSYSESGQLDHIIPQHIAHDLGFKWIFKNLDAGNDLMDIDESVDVSDMRVYYPWASQLNDFLKYTATKELGLVFTGVIGDVVVGTFCHDLNQIHKNYEFGNGTYSRVLLEKLRTKHQDEQKKVSYEYGMFNNRAFNGACLGYSTTFQNYSEALSPFMYKPFFDFCMRIPAERRYQHDLYFKWIRKYYPGVLKFSWNGMTIPRHEGYIRIKDKKIYFDTIPSRIKGAFSAKLKKDYGMNPMDYWYNHNLKLRNRMDQYYDSHIAFIDGIPELKEDIEKLYSGYGVIEKTMCISLLGFCEELLNEDI